MALEVGRFYEKFISSAVDFTADSFTLLLKSDKVHG